MCDGPCFRYFHRDQFVFAKAENETSWVQEDALDENADEDANEIVAEDADKNAEEGIDEEEVIAEHARKTSKTKRALTPVPLNRGLRSLKSKTKSNPKRQKKT